MGARLSLKISSTLDRQLKAKAEARAISKSDMVREILCRHVLKAKSVEMREAGINRSHFRNRRAAV